MRLLEVLFRPACLIILGGIIGYFIGGIVGVLIGLVAGYVFAFFLGGLVGLVWGGPVPRQLRQSIANAFMEQSAELARRMFPSKTDQEVIDCIDRSVNDLFKKAREDNAHLGENWSARQFVHHAYLEVRGLQQAEVYGQYWDELWNVTEAVTYPAAAG